jgi:hypothetical protein
VNNNLSFHLSCHVAHVLSICLYLGSLGSGSSYLQSFSHFSPTVFFLPLYFSSAFGAAIIRASHSPCILRQPPAHRGGHHVAISVSFFLSIFMCPRVVQDPENLMSHGSSHMPDLTKTWRTSPCFCQSRLEWCGVSNRRPPDIKVAPLLPTFLGCFRIGSLIRARWKSPNVCAATCEQARL